MGVSVRPDPVADYLAARDSARAANSASDPVADYLAAKKAAASSASSVPSTPTRPGVVSRTLSSLADEASNAVQHPIRTLKSIVTAPIQSAMTLNRAAAEQDAENAVASSGGPIGAVARSVTSTQARDAALQTAANLAAPDISGAAKSVVARIGLPKLVTTAGLAASGAAIGAAYNPNDPIVGAVSGALVTPLAGLAGKGVSEGLALKKLASRVKAAPEPGDVAIQHDADIKATNAVNYGAVEEQGKANPSTPALTDALNHPTIKPVADAFRASSVGTGATDAETARSVDKLMTTQRRGIQKRMESKEGNYNYDDALQIEQIKAAQKILRNAIASPSEKPPLSIDVPAETKVVEPTITPGRESLDGPPMQTPLTTYTSNPKPTLSQALRNFQGGADATRQGPGGPAFRLRAQPDVVKPGVTIETPAMHVQTAPAEPVAPSMESYPDAIGDMARMKGERKAFNNAVDQTRRIVNQTPIKGNKLTEQGGPAFLQQIKNQPENQASASALGQLSALRELNKPRPLSMNATMFGKAADRTIRPLSNINAMRQYVDAADQQSGRSVSPVDLKAALQRAALINAGLARRDSTP